MFAWLPEMEKAIRAPHAESYFENITGADDGRGELLKRAFEPLWSYPDAAPMPVSEGGFLPIMLSQRAGISYTVETVGSSEDAVLSAREGEFGAAGAAS